MTDPPKMPLPPVMSASADCSTGAGVVADGVGVAGGDGGLAVGPVGGLAVVGRDADVAGAVRDGLLADRRGAAHVGAVGETLPAATLPPVLATAGAGVEHVGVLVDDHQTAERAAGGAGGGLGDLGVGLVAGGRGVAGVDRGLAVGVVGGLAVVAGDAAVARGVLEEAGVVGRSRCPGRRCRRSWPAPTTELVTVASWLITRMPPSAPWAEPWASWLMVVFDWLPTAEALPVEIVAEPLLLLPALPLLLATPGPAVGVLRGGGVVVRRVADRDVAAGVGHPQRPCSYTLACWLITWMVPRFPETVTVWVLLVPDWLPTAVASPSARRPCRPKRCPHRRSPAWATRRAEQGEQCTTGKGESEVADEPAARVPIQFFTGAGSQRGLLQEGLRGRGAAS